MRKKNQSKRSSNPNGSFNKRSMSPSRLISRLQAKNRNWLMIFQSSQSSIINNQSQSKNQWLMCLSQSSQRSRSRVS